MAEEHCASLAGHLTSIHSKEELEFVGGVIGEKFFFWTGGYREEGGVEPWSWKWSDGSAWDFTNWYPTEPDNYFGDEYFVLMYSDFEMVWYDHGDDKFPSICKKPVMM